MDTIWDKVVSTARKEKRTYLLEHECKQILEKTGIPTTGAALARTAAEAVAFSEAIGFPVVLKVLSPEVVHKSDAGGVQLNLANAAAVERAYQKISKTFAGQKLVGAAVQKMAPPGLEAIVGISRDPTFGPVLMFGLGGVFVEVLQDVSFRILPVTEKDIEEMIQEIRGYALLQGYRGAAVDLSALKNLLGRLAALALSRPEISEVDLNPVFLYTTGNITVDARIFLEETAGEKPVVTKIPSPSPHPGPPREKRSLHKLFYPQSIAVIGASDSPGKLGWNVFNNLLYHRFAGRLYPVNIKAPSVQGVAAVPNVGAIKEPVDAAIILVPAEHTLQAFEECCRRGIKFVVIESAGFAETGTGGENVQTALKKTAEKYNCRFLGPNCSGIINTHHHMVQSIGIVRELRKGNIGLIAQAGVYAAGMLWGMRHTMDFGIVATIGNKADLNETDILEYFGEDENLSVVCLYLEDVRSGRRFIDVARTVTARKPVIVLKSGRTAAGKKAASSHTASLAGNDLIYDAAFRQAGIIRARDNDHLFGLARAFSKQPLPQGAGALVISYTGSLGVAAADALSLNNLQPAELGGETYRQLREIVPPYVGCNNPVDYTFDMNAELVRKTLEIGLHDQKISSFIVVLQAEILETYVQVLPKIDLQGKPLLCCVPCREFAMNEVIALEQAGIPVYSTPEEAVEILAAMYRYKMQQG
jgi:acyl-CoA synthetase (NDP forming)